MVTTLILTHGELAHELLSAAEVILGRVPPFYAVALDWGDSVEEATRKTREALSALDSAGGILILTDMYGGTPYNVAVGFREPGRVEVVTGVNLPMVVRLGCPGAPNEDLVKLAGWIQDKGRASISRAPAAGSKQRDRRRPVRSGDREEAT